MDRATATRNMHRKFSEVMRVDSQTNRHTYIDTLITIRRSPAGAEQRYPLNDSKLALQILDQRSFRSKVIVDLWVLYLDY